MTKMKLSTSLCFFVVHLCCILIAVKGQGPNCIEPVMADVSFVADQTLNMILVGMNQNISVINFTTSCLSVGTMRDRYRLATVVIYFTTPSNLFQSNGCLPNTVCLSYLEMSCSSDSNTWVFNDVFFFDSFTIDGNTTLFLDSNLPPRTDCGSCGYIESIPFVAVFDPLTHCFGCNDVCKDNGLDFCTGVTTTTCCNFYLDNTCVSDCDGNNRIANLATNFSCICNNSFTGSNCDVCPLTCDGINNEFCFCVCPPGFTGDNCDINIDDCAGINCNNGTCADKIESFACNCFEDYQGTFCTETINQCNSSTCLNGGTCIDGNGTFVCNCLMGYTSTNCEQLVDNCINSPCINGQCMNSLNNFTCDCDDNFSGRFCEICTLTNCNNCSTNFANVCDDCEMPYYNNNGTCGLICDVLSPCLNGGTCIPTNTGYNCSCPPGYTGINCSIDLCDSIICMNGGTCVQGICRCEASFNGTRCENCLLDNCMLCSRDINGTICVRCDSGFQLNNGTCVAVPTRSIESSVSVMPPTSSIEPSVSTVPPNFSALPPINPTSSIMPSNSINPATSPMATNSINPTTTAKPVASPSTTITSMISPVATPTPGLNVSIDIYLIKWKETAAVCSYSFNDCANEFPTSYDDRYKCYKKLQKEWEKSAKPQLKHQAETETSPRMIKKWRDSLKKSLKNIEDWIKYIYDNFEITLEQVPNLDTKNAPLDVLYSEYIMYWHNLFKDFNEKIVPDYCIQ